MNVFCSIIKLGVFCYRLQMRQRPEICEPRTSLILTCSVNSTEKLSNKTSTSANKHAALITQLTHEQHTPFSILIHEGTKKAVGTRIFMHTLSITCNLTSCQALYSINMTDKGSLLRALPTAAGSMVGTPLNWDSSQSCSSRLREFLAIIDFCKWLIFHISS